MLSTACQMMQKWTAPTLWQIYFLHSNKRSLLEEGRRTQNDVWFISTIALFTLVGFQEIGSKNMTCAACHSHPIRLISLQWLLLFSYSEKSSNGLRWLMKTSLWLPASDFEGYRSQRIESSIWGLGMAGSRSKWRYWRLRRMINIFYLW
jgi:hypothetical protein